jgi:hypothetical protein
MSLVITTEYALQKIAPPALPQPTDEYSRAYHDQLNNVLRIYFNRLQNIIAQLNTNTAVVTVANLPSAVTSGVGAMSFVSDAIAPAFGVAVVGGGAVPTPVYSDGAIWRVG